MIERLDWHYRITCWEPGGWNLPAANLVAFARETGTYGLFFDSVVGLARGRETSTTVTRDLVDILRERLADMVARHPDLEMAGPRDVDRHYTMLMWLKDRAVTALIVGCPIVVSRYLP